MNISSRSLAFFAVGLVPIGLLWWFAFRPWDSIEGLTFGAIAFAWGLVVFSAKNLPGGKHVGAIGYLTLVPVAGFAAITIPLSIILAAINCLIHVPLGLALSLYVLLLVAFFFVHSALAAANAHSIRNDAAETQAIRSLKAAAFRLGELEAGAPPEVRGELRLLKDSLSAAPVDIAGVAIDEDRTLAELMDQMEGSLTDAGALRALAGQAHGVLKRRAFTLRNARR